jgi:hypothetical protein
MIFYNQEEAIESLESLWETFRDLADELGYKNWEDGKLELVLTRLPDAAAIAEEQRERHVVLSGPPSEQVYRTAPPDPSWTDSDEEPTDPYTETSTSSSSSNAMDTT